MRKPWRKTRRHLSKPFTLRQFNAAGRCIDCLPRYRHDDSQHDMHVLMYDMQIIGVVRYTVTFNERFN